jgi:hypothetical protein
VNINSDRHNRVKNFRIINNWKVDGVIEWDDYFLSDTYEEGWFDSYEDAVDYIECNNNIHWEHGVYWVIVTKDNYNSMLKISDMEFL